MRPLPRHRSRQAHPVLPGLQGQRLPARGSGSGLCALQDQSRRRHPCGECASPGQLRVAARRRARSHGQWRRPPRLLQHRQRAGDAVCRPAGSLESRQPGIRAHAGEAARTPRLIPSQPAAGRTALPCEIYRAHGHGDAGHDPPLPGSRPARAGFAVRDGFVQTLWRPPQPESPEPTPQVKQPGSKPWNNWRWRSLSPSPKSPCKSRSCSGAVEPLSREDLQRQVD